MWDYSYTIIAEFVTRNVVCFKSAFFFCISSFTQQLYDPLGLIASFYQLNRRFFILFFSPYSQFQCLFSLITVNFLLSYADYCS